MAGNSFSQKERPFRARWLSPSTSGKPDYYIYNHFFYTCQEKSEKNQVGQFVDHVSYVPDL